jgi:hypothetical protein
MANELKELFDASTALTITVAGLASSTTGVGRQSTIVDNTSERYQKIILYIKITVGTTPTANRTIRFYLIRDDNNGTNHRSDGAGSADAGLTVLNARPIGSILVPINTTDVAYYAEFEIYDPGPKWGIAVVHDTGVNLNATGSNHWIRYVGANPEVQ